MVFGIFKDEKIEKIAAAIDKEFKNIKKVGSKYKKGIKLSDFKKEYKSKKLKHGKHPMFASYKIAEWVVDIDEDIVPFKFFAEIQEGKVTGIRFNDHPDYYGLEGGLTEHNQWKTKPDIGLASTHDPEAMKLKKFILKKYGYEDMKRINPELWV
tara:strand:+ start:160 stop:621 length:462 start_codon:yes stop_codon:yes gene_type:complete